MARTVLLLGLLLVTTAANAQVFPLPLTPPGIATTFAPTFTNSVIDHNGNVMIFDPSQFYAPSPDQPRVMAFPSPKTHLTVITADGQSKKAFDYDGSLQVIGVGRRAVYAVLATYSVSVSPAPNPAGSPTGGVATATAGAIAVSVTRKLVALNVVAGTLPSTLPSLSSIGGADVKVSPVGDDGAPDSIALIDSVSSIGPVVSSIFSPAHAVRLFTFDGAKFSDPKDPIPVP